MQIRKLTALGLYTALSLAVYAAESVLPPLAPIPGFKLGMANIVTLILLKRYSPKDAALVLTARILLSALLFGQAMSLIYSLTGGFCSLLVMCLVNHILSKKMLPLTGAMGGLSHNGGQLLAALCLTATPGVMVYLPILLPAGIFTGLFTGLCAQLTVRYLLRQVH